MKSRPTAPFGERRSMPAAIRQEPRRSNELGNSQTNPLEGARGAERQMGKWRPLVVVLAAPSVRIRGSGLPTDRLPRKLLLASVLIFPRSRSVSARLTSATRRWSSRCRPTWRWWRRWCWPDRSASHRWGLRREGEYGITRYPWWLSSPRGAKGPHLLSHFRAGHQPPPRHSGARYWWETGNSRSTVHSGSGARWQSGPASVGVPLRRQRPRRRRGPQGQRGNGLYSAERIIGKRYVSGELMYQGNGSVL